MDFETYETSGQQIYAKLASTMASIMDVIVRDLASIKVQQIQHRVKSASSLKKKIEERKGSLDDDVETHAKDVAGCRVILYTNDDVARFIQSPVMWDNFEIDWDRTKFHYPLDDTAAEELFISYNYVVKLKEQRTSLPEYADLAGKWCEVQVQTTLDHAWSEMHHDTVYKPPAGGFGSAVLNDVKARMAKIMQEHLLPAGFDFQKVSDDVRRLENARTFFETRPLERIVAEIDNNERHELLETYRDEVVPHLDNLDAEAPSVREAINEAVAKAAATPQVPILYGDHEFEGKTVDEIIDVSLDILDRLRYRGEDAIQSTWTCLGVIYDITQTERARARALRSVKSLAENNLHVWRQAGPWAQCEIAGLLSDAVEQPDRRQLVVAAAEAILDPEIEGTTSASDSFTIHQGAVRPSEQLGVARGQAISALETLLFTPGPEDEKRVFTALLQASTFPYNTNYDAALIAMVRTDTLRIVEIAKRLALTVDPFLRASLESSLLQIYRQVGGGGPTDEQDQGITTLSDRLLLALEDFRDTVSADPLYAVHKTLVGHDAVSRTDWDRPSLDFDTVQAERANAVKTIVDDLTHDTFGHYLPTILSVASVRSDDGATFICFQDFLTQLGRDKPTVALRLVAEHETELAEFLWSLLDGLSNSFEAEEAKNLCRAWIGRGMHLRQILGHCSNPLQFDQDLFEHTARAVLVGHDIDATLRLVDCATRLASAQPSVIASALLPAIRRAASVNDRRWIDRTWFLWNADYASLFTEAQIDEMLVLAHDVPVVGSHEEWWLAAIASAWPQKVLDWLAGRIVLQRDRERGVRFEAIPFRFHRLNAAFDALPAEVIAAARGSFVPSDFVFEYSGGRLVEQVFPDLTPIVDELRPFAVGTDEDRTFLLRILAAYNGSPVIDALCRDLVAATEPGSLTWSAVENAIDSTGVVSGEFGMVEANQIKRAALQAWASDDRPLVQQFASGHILSLDRQIAAGRRQSMEEYQLRKRQYGEA